MPLDAAKARQQWIRYIYARDTGHTEFVRKANRCEQFVSGDQWDKGDRDKLKAARRPALTINKILITLASITGEQIETRSETVFQPRYGANPATAEALTKIFKYVSDRNKLDWTRTEVFADGCVTGRGYYDVRLDFEHNVTGDIAIKWLDPRNVLPDPDADRYDPDTWNDVIVSTWMTADDIAILYNADDAETLRQRASSSWAFGFDSIDFGFSRFGGNIMAAANVSSEIAPMLRNIRVLERQYRLLKRQKMFVDMKQGIKRDVPESWDRDTIALALQENPNLTVVDEVVRRIKWMVTADDFVLHEDWSPYKHFTVVPYFPVFRHGRTIGLVEHLIDPQELLNKTMSQELHVVNTMANSGWKVRHGALVNMTLEELEELGAKTGLVLSTQGDPEKDIVKIQPNQVPAGLDRISFKAEQFIQTISGRGDSVMGLDRADVSAKAIGEKKDSAFVPLRPALDSLTKTDFMLARNVLDIVQQYMTDPQIVNITQDDVTGEVATLAINQPVPGSGEFMNDLSEGEFDVVVTSQAVKRTLSESQFEQAAALRSELGVQIPDRFLIENSNLIKKGEIIKALDEQANGEQAQAQQQIALLGQQLELANLKAEASAEEAKAVKYRADATSKLAELQSGGMDKAGELQLKQQEHDQKMQHMREEHQQKLQLKEQEAAVKRRADMINASVQAVQAARQAKAQPQPARA